MIDVMQWVDLGGGQGILCILIFLELWMGLGMGILSFLELYKWIIRLKDKIVIIFGRLCKITIVSKKYLVLDIGKWNGKI